MELVTLPSVAALSSMKLYNPIRIVLTLHMGFQLSGWKSDMLRQSRLEQAKRPFGVIIITDGGFIGY